jgi:hypothetical protein
MITYTNIALKPGITERLVKRAFLNDGGNLESRGIPVHRELLIV